MFKVNGFERITEEKKQEQPSGKENEESPLAGVLRVLPMCYGTEYDQLETEVTHSVSFATILANKADMETLRWSNGQLLFVKHLYKLNDSHSSASTSQDPTTHSKKTANAGSKKSGQTQKSSKAMSGLEVLDS